MLTYGLLKNHAGVMLVGDYGSLLALHDVVHDVNEDSPLIRNLEGSLLGLAHDARKAYEQQREIIKPPEHSPQIGTRFGVRILWPVLLVQCRMLRASLGYIDSTKRQQAVTYSLEAVIESALRMDFGAKAELLIERWMRIDPRDAWAEENLSSRGAVFCSWKKADRRIRLPGLLASLDPMYPTLYPLWLSSGDTSLVAPEEFEAWEDVDWPDPKW